MESAAIMDSVLHRSDTHSSLRVRWSEASLAQESLRVKADAFACTAEVLSETWSEQMERFRAIPDSFRLVHVLIIMMPSKTKTKKKKKPVRCGICMCRFSSAMRPVLLSTCAAELRALLSALLGPSEEAREAQPWAQQLGKHLEVLAEAESVHQQQGLVEVGGDCSESNGPSHYTVWPIMGFPLFFCNISVIFFY